MQASCTPNMKVSTQILGPINFGHLANQTGGILRSPPTPTQGGSSSSTLVMTTSLDENINSYPESILNRVSRGEIANCHESTLYCTLSVLHQFSRLKQIQTVVHLLYEMRTGRK